jgi:putative peptidoglycan lipid II flippase
MVEILARAFYALHDTKTPVFIGISAMSLNVLLSYGFSALFRQLGWLPHGGLAAANSLATGLEMIGLILIMRKRLGGLDGKQIWSGFLKFAASAVIMAVVLVGWSQLLRGSSDLVLAGGGILSGLLVYTAGLWLLRTKELHQALCAVKARISGAQS